MTSSQLDLEAYDNGQVDRQEPTPVDTEEGSQLRIHMKIRKARRLSNETQRFYARLYQL